MFEVSQLFMVSAGKEEKCKEIAKRMLADKKPIEEIKKYTNLTAAEIQSLIRFDESH